MFNMIIKGGLLERKQQEGVRGNGEADGGQVNMIAVHHIPIQK
jgi:hypothetical protein